MLCFLGNMPNGPVGVLSWLQGVGHPTPKSFLRWKEKSGKIIYAGGDVTSTNGQYTITY